MAGATDDHALVARMATGDEAALRALFVSHQLRVFRFVQRLVGNAAIAEELTNEVFLEVWRGAAAYEARASVTTWIFSIAHHRAVSMLRKRRDENWNEDEANEIPDDADDPEVVSQKADKAEVMRTCLAALAPSDRTVVDLVYYHEMSIHEVSTVIGIPEGTVKTRLFHARKRLSVLLKEAGIDRGWP